MAQPNSQSLKKLGGVYFYDPTTDKVYEETQAGVAGTSTYIEITGTKKDDIKTKYGSKITAVGGDLSKKEAADYKTQNTSPLPIPESLRYPRDIGTGDSDYMIFEFFNYVPPFSSKVAIGNAASYNSYNSSINNLQKKAGYPQIILYMPEGVSVSYKANWDGKKFGNIAAGVLQTAGAVAGGDGGGSAAG